MTSGSASQDLLNKITNAVLYEGYLLYPYRASAIKNRQRFNFGVLVPEAYSRVHSGNEAWTMQTECLVRGAHSILSVNVRFLHLLKRQVEQAVSIPAVFRAVESLDVGGVRYQSWQEAVERAVAISELKLSDLLGDARQLAFEFDSNEHIETILDQEGHERGRLVRTQLAIQGTVSLEVNRLEVDLFRVRLTIANITALPDAAMIDREQALRKSFASAHAVLSVNVGEFVSLLEPPEELADAAAGCRQVGCWPVLVGNAGDRQTMLASPIILYDYPEIAAESPGDFFDGTEMDEMLMLRVMTMTPAEKNEMKHVDEQARQLLHRTENMTPEGFLRLHGRLSRTPSSDQ